MRILLSTIFALVLVTGTGSAQSEYVVEFKQLYDELQEFKDSQGFQTYGFSVAGPYKQWQERAEALREADTEKTIYGQTEASVGDLLILGNEYIKVALGRGDWEYINWVEGIIEDGLGRFDF